MRTGVVSTEDTTDIWKTAREEAIGKTKRRTKRSVRVDSLLPVESEVEHSFCLRVNRPDGWVTNRKMKKIETSDCGELHFQDMWKVVELQHTPILKGLGGLAAEREWEVEVVPLVVGQRSVKEKEWLIGKEDGSRIIRSLGHTLLNEHETLFGRYWRHTLGRSRSLSQLLGKGISVRVPQPFRGGQR